MCTNEESSLAKQCYDYIYSHPLGGSVVYLVSFGQLLVHYSTIASKLVCCVLCSGTFIMYCCVLGSECVQVCQYQTVTFCGLPHKTIKQ